MFEGVVMSGLILHTTYLSEAHQLRFNYLFEVAIKRWHEHQPDDPSKPPTQLLVVDAHHAAAAMTQRPDHTCLLLIATDAQAQDLRTQWPHQIDGQLPPDYSVAQLTQVLEHISLQAHSNRLREALKTRRMQHQMPGSHDPQTSAAESTMAPTPQPPIQSIESATPAPASAPAVPATPAPEARPAATRYRIKRWTQLTGSMAGQGHRQALAALISGDRSIDELNARSTLTPAELERLLQVLRGKGLLIEISPPAPELPLTPTIQTTPADAPPAPAPAPSIKRSFFRQLSRWIGQNRPAADSHS